jgi:hypothetical protein
VFCIFFNILSGGFGRTVWIRIGNASDLITGFGEFFLFLDQNLSAAALLIMDTALIYFEVYLKN